MNLSDADVAEIIRILEGSGYGELELETERFRLLLRRNADGAGWSQQRESRSDAPPEAAALPDRPAEPAAAVTDDPGEDSGLLRVDAPIVGTFYRAPAPGEAPFVEVGSRVEPDTVVAIIEVMKLMNSVPAGVSGEVAEVCVENAELVRQGQCLLRVRPDPE